MLTYSRDDIARPIEGLRRTAELTLMQGDGTASDSELISLTFKVRQLHQCGKAAVCYMLPRNIPVLFFAPQFLPSLNATKLGPL